MLTHQTQPYVNSFCKKGHNVEYVSVNIRGHRFCKECLKESGIKYRTRQHERVKELARLSRDRNKEARNLYSRKYSKDNPDKFKTYRSKRRATKTRAGGCFTTEEWFTLCFSVGFRCLYCGEIKPLEADHIVPVSKGGTSWLWNIQPLCETCNGKKYTDSTDYRLLLPEASDFLDSRRI